MSEDREVIPNPDQGFFDSIVNYLRLVWRLLMDGRVNNLLKIIPFFSLVYLVSPFDIPLPIDDAAVIWLTSYLFIELCPPEVVAEHRQAIEQELSLRWSENNTPEVEEEDIVDADFTDD